jgi:FkbM family methyltransferase
MKVKSALNLPLKYRYRRFSILLPADHMLPIYQLRHHKYDRLLPCLVGHLPANETIVDVGANVGDTLAAMAESNATLNYICIEPDGLYFEYLQRNIHRIRRALTGVTISAVKSLVGKNVSGVSLEGVSGTKHAVQNQHGGIASVPLDRLLADAACSNIRLIKSDVDGFDYDVLDSSISIVRAQKPMLYFECQCNHEYQVDGYAKTLLWLESEGYCDWTIFDNYGEIVVRTKLVSELIQQMRNIWNQTVAGGARTIYYLDVLAVQDRDAALIDRVLAEYVA